jgi:hypothetical protein
VGANAISPSTAKPKRKYLFIGFPELDGKQRHLMLLLGSDQAAPISVYTVFQCIAPTGDSLQNELDTDDQNAIAAPKLALGASLESPVPVVYSKRQKRL